MHGRMFGWEDSALSSHRAEFNQSPDRVLVEGVLTGRVVEACRHAVGVAHGAAAGQDPGGRGHLLRGEEVVVVVVVVVVVEPRVLLLERVSVVVWRVSVDGQHVGGLVEVGVGGGRRGLPGQGQRAAGLPRGEGGAAGQGAAVVGAGGGQDDGLHALLEQGAGCRLQNEFGALNALVLVTLGQEGVV